MGTPGESSSDTAHSDPIHLLFVHGNVERAARASALLEREDDRFDTITATSAADGLEYIDECRVDCIVSADDTSDMDGLAFLEAVRQRDETLPFILFTDTGSEELASEAISAGVTDYVQNSDETSQYPVLANRISTAVEQMRTTRQHERQRRAIETAQEGISLLDTDGTFIYVNQSYADCFGYEPEALIGEHWDLLYEDDEATFVHENILPTVRDEGDWRGETDGIRADGSPIVVDHTLSMTEHGELICTVRSITDRKKRERDLERYETIIEAIGDPVYTVDSDGCYSFVNDAYAEITGYTKAEIIGKPIQFLIDDASVERGTDTVRSLLSGDTAATQQAYEITVVTKDGTRIQCEDNVSLLPLEDGRYRGVAGVVRNITERKERERELEQYETILTAIPDEVYVLDADGYFTNVIPAIGAAVTAIGCSPEEQIGEHVSVAISDDDIATGERIIQELVADDGRERASYEMDLHTKDGNRIPTENHLALLPTDEENEFQGTVGVLRDITARKERERALERQNERLDSFASIVSHDLRNPLNVAQGRLGLARDDHDSANLEVVSQAHERMQVLIEDILAVAREDKPVTETEPIDLAVFARMCWQNVETRTATLTVATDAIIQVNKSRFKRLLENLIRNAVEHGTTAPEKQAHEDGSDQQSTDSHSEAGAAIVALTIGELPDEAGFYVEDDGPGIPPDEREQVFENGYSTADDGTGFGLSIVKQIAAAHGWSVRITDSETGGARFEFRGVENYR